METHVLAFHDCHKILELTKVQRGKFILIQFQETQTVVSWLCGFQTMAWREIPCLPLTARKQRTRNLGASVSLSKVDITLPISMHLTVPPAPDSKLVMKPLTCGPLGDTLSKLNGENGKDWADSNLSLISPLHGLYQATAFQGGSDRGHPPSPAMGVL